MQRGADVARLRHRLDDVVGEFGRVWGGEPDPLQPVDVSAGPQQLGESSPITGQCGVGERDAVGVDVLAEQGDFEHTVVHQGPHLGQDVCRAAVDLPTPQRRDDAERAAVVAAHRDGNPRGIGRFAGAGQRRRELLQRLGDFDLGDLVVPGALQQRGQRPDVVGAEDNVYPRRPAQHGVAVFLRQAATDRDLHVGIGALARGQMAEVAVQPVVGVLADGAGVEHHDVGLGTVGRPPVAGRFQQTRQPLGVVDVHLTAVGADLIGARWRSPHGRPGALAGHPRGGIVRHHRSHGAMVRRLGGSRPSGWCRLVAASG